MREALWAELLKVRRSRLLWLTALAFTVAAAMCGLFMFILQDPQRARTLGLLGDKAQLSGAVADWSGHLGLLAQAVGVSGVMIYGISVIWLFGREFSDHTAKDLLALPTSRMAIVAAKFTVAAVWSVLLAIQAALLGLLIGTALGLPGWSAQAITSGVIRVLVTGALTFVLTTPFGLAASLGRGYLSAVGAMFAALFSAQVLAALGFGAYFPWSVPGLYAGLGGPDQDPPGFVGYLLVAAVGIAGVAATVIWWQRADHTR
ncbi:ABC transporter permease [Microbispora triticiradicis]|uniref:ABC transporter permease n=1 Tax=Microbispora triticiradicis TaxID=2200763 RepID=UPI001AD72AFA|nr:ABC transporter permease [Microbispora triticiradicis]MBO4269443.1 ABC transporter permease subunit [Microbispora triticiradicis]